jgi:hypothetical protein
MAGKLLAGAKRRYLNKETLPQHVPLMPTTPKRFF